MLRTWIEYGFQQVKNELGWKDYRLTEYRSVERWWELIFSAYLLVSLHAEDFKSNLEGDCQASKQTMQTYLPFSRHLYWELGNTWKSALNNLRLLMQPYCCWGWLEPWLELVPIPELRRGLVKLMDFINIFRMSPIPLAKAA
ncbi:hypothetical protein H6F93_00770 [Leptolyngbya sp. FACHB-671]|uniref:hypothetical protein n=1 Tax=Leptolyngbya sp. FACHB-671 TaxID=2692812 RepID=UPI001689C221|nr:hypothetical protein [Leptolyngbya sp. FACHB-671]MBD2066078.1 hypothetical protein [Leptolyngbya sp. FACHB-671]